MREKEKTTSILFVRHGQADFPQDRLYCDEREDPPLTAEGLLQAQRAAALLEGQSIDAIYSSPMQRTRTTAEQIAARCGAQVIFDPKLKERPFGIWDGLYFDAIARDYPEQFQAWKKDPVSFVPEGGEPIHAHMERVKMAIRQIVENHRGRRIAVVSHVGPIRMCLTDALEMPLTSYRRLTIDYASVTRVDYGSKQNNLVYMNISGKV
ncbi:MAG: histidine phosphatase family protein [Gammaproteobacteria bacterium]|nr:histidine phosphatase family protein [Gammaproteobacteria bacterium]